MEDLTKIPGENDWDSDIPSSNRDLLNTIQEGNPYPKGHVIATLRDKTSKENKLKLQKNIRINSRGNVEAMGREFIVLSAEPNEIDIVKKDGTTYFMGDAAQREAEAQGFTLFDTEEQADIFIEQFTGKDDFKDNKIINMLRIFGLYDKESKKTGQRDARIKKRVNLEQSYATLTKGDGNGRKYVIKCKWSWKDGVLYEAELNKVFAENGHPAIVSRPV